MKDFLLELKKEETLTFRTTRKRRNSLKGDTVVVLIPWSRGSETFTTRLERCEVRSSCQETYLITYELNLCKIVFYVTRILVYKIFTNNRPVLSVLCYHLLYFGIRYTNIKNFYFIGK